MSYAGSAITTANARFLYADPRGSIVLAANSSGAATATNAYDEYGIPGSANAGRFQYTGQVWLPEFGLYYYKARMYSPTLGRSMQTDPIGYADNTNLYAYVGNDPVNFVDPSGLQQELPKKCPHREENIQVCRRSIGQITSSLQQTALGQHPSGPARIPRRDKSQKSRSLTDAEKEFLMCNGASQDDVDTFKLTSGLPYAFYLRSRVNAVTMPRSGGQSEAYFRNGIAEMSSNLGQRELIAHEFEHHLQYRHGGLTLDSYVGGWIANGLDYDSLPSEVDARYMALFAMENFRNGICR